MSEELRHTPGEWYACREEHTGPQSSKECYRIDIRGNPFLVNGRNMGSEPICSLYAGFVHFEGNAALLLAAPDILRELIDFHDHTIDQGWHQCEGIPGGCPVADAIQKARTKTTDRNT